MSEFLQYIYKWYDANHRKLPWRETSDPYKIWLSEIILQQTRVDQGTQYYLNFIEKFPTVQELANATEDDVLKLWQGLGYYSRARNLHFTAKFVSEKLNGKFPENYDDLLKLKGVGPYTAAAIASIAFNLPQPTVDGNIFRVLSRYFGVHTPIDSNTGKKEFSALAHELVPKKNAGFHNQSLMEFGALQCVPKSPDCVACPVNETCYAYSKYEVARLPIKLKKTNQRKRYFHYFLPECQEFIYLEKRTGNDIWKNLFQFPLVETNENLSAVEAIEKHFSDYLSGCNGEIKYVSKQKKHILSHQVIHARLVHFTIEKPDCFNGRFIKVDKKDISKFAVPKLIDLFLEEIDI